jgi:hypothetical protein
MSKRMLREPDREDERRRRGLGAGGKETPRSRRAVLAPLVLGVLALAAATFAMARGGEEPRISAPVAVAPASAPFGQHYDGLVQRRKAANVPTMMETMNSPVHLHPVLKVLVDGREVPVPANIGIDPLEDGMQMAGLHTHDTTGTIHVEGVRGARLGQFFAVWGVPFSARQLGPYHASAGKSVRMWVDGKASDAYGALELADGQRIVVSFARGLPPCGG